jgi:hypothetical protein
MTVLIDEAIWPAHGTVWAHLVSDSSLDELHSFARRAGIPERGFDHDHYDVPLERREAIIALGAEPVRSGLRVTQAEKKELARRASRSTRWE